MVASLIRSDRPGRQARLGHTTPGAAMRYQHAATDHDAEIARRLSALVEPPGAADTIQR
jgi:hypothetical protein